MFSQGGFAPFGSNIPPTFIRLKRTTSFWIWRVQTVFKIFSFKTVIIMSFPFSRKDTLIAKNQIFRIFWVPPHFVTLLKFFFSSELWQCSVFKCLFPSKVLFFSFTFTKLILSGFVKSAYNLFLTFIYFLYFSPVKCLLNKYGFLNIQKKRFKSKPIKIGVGFRANPKIVTMFFFVSYLPNKKLIIHTFKRIKKDSRYY